MYICIYTYKCHPMSSRGSRGWGLQGLRGATTLKRELEDRIPIDCIIP